MRLLAFERLPEHTRFNDTPVGYALTALWHGERLLLVRVRGRDCWELPGGRIEPGETRRQAAARELREESGQVIAEDMLRFAGFARTALPSRSVLRGALFHASAEETRGHVPTEEISAIHWWELDNPPPGDGMLQTVDTYLARLTRKARPSYG